MSLTILSVLFCTSLDLARKQYPHDMAWGEWTGFNHMKLNLGLITLITSLIYSEQIYLAKQAGESSVPGRILQDDLIRRYWSLLLGQLWFFISLEAWFTNTYQFIANPYLSATLLLVSSLATAVALAAAFTADPQTNCVPTTFSSDHGEFYGSAFSLF